MNLKKICLSGLVIMALITNATAITAQSNEVDSRVSSNNSNLILADSQAKNNTEAELSTSVGTIGFYEGKLSVEDMKADVDYAVEWILSHHPDAKESGFTSEQKKIIDTVYSNITVPMTKDEFFFQINRIFTMMGDMLTKLEYTPYNGSYLNVPFVWLDEGMFVYKSTGEFVEGDEILSIGGKTPSELLQMLYEQMSAENDYYIKANAAQILTNGAYLQYYQLVNDDNTVDIEIKRDNQKLTIKEKLGKVYRYNNAQSNSDWVSWNIEKGNNLGYFRFDKCPVKDQDQERFDRITRAIDEFFASVSQNNIGNIVFDIRENEGATTHVLRYLLRYIPARSLYYSKNKEYNIAAEYGIPDDDLLYTGNVYVMTSSGTTASAVLIADMLQANGIARVIGEPTGQRPAFNAYDKGVANGTLLKTGWSFLMTCGKNERALDRNADDPAVFPDIPVYTAIDDVLSGRDIQMEIMREIASRRNWIYVPGTLEIGDFGTVMIIEAGSNFVYKDRNVFISEEITDFGNDNVWLENTIDHHRINVGIRKLSTGMEITIPDNLKEGESYYLVVKGNNNTYAALLTVK